MPFVTLEIWHFHQWGFIYFMMTMEVALLKQQVWTVMLRSCRDRFCNCIVRRIWMCVGSSAAMRPLPSEIVALALVCARVRTWRYSLLLAWVSQDEILLPLLRQNCQKARRAKQRSWWTCWLTVLNRAGTRQISIIIRVAWLMQFWLCFILIIGSDEGSSDEDSATLRCQDWWTLW